MQISLDEKNISFHFCIHINYVTYELAHNLLLTIAVMTLLQCQGPEGNTSPAYWCPAVRCLPPMLSTAQFLSMKHLVTE